ncbi:MAG TPA: hypothetical protein VGD72_09015 [Mycobacteriales bacterium]|jgi:hypothetical protein
MDENPNHTSQTVAAVGDPDVTMEVLRSHVPLTLLMDLGSVDGPDSAGISAVEGGDAAWLQRGTAHGAGAAGEHVAG